MMPCQDHPLQKRTPSPALRCRCASFSKGYSFSSQHKTINHDEDDVGPAGRRGPGASPAATGATICTTAHRAHLQGHAPRAVVNRKVAILSARTAPVPSATASTTATVNPGGFARMPTACRIACPPSSSQPYPNERSCIFIDPCMGRQAGSLILLCGLHTAMTYSCRSATIGSTRMARRAGT
jgi:hypothetical protein